MTQPVITKEQFFDFYVLSLIPRGVDSDADAMRTIVVNEIRTNYLKYIEEIVRAEASYQQKRKDLHKSPLRVLAKNFFVPGMWAPSFGSAPWGRIATALCDLKDAKTEEQMILLIDHIHDLEHNTATVMNRCMSGETFKQWLDLKFNATPQELVKFCSKDVKKVATPMNIKRVSQVKKVLDLNDFEKRMTIAILRDEVQECTDKGDVEIVDNIINNLYEDGVDVFKGVDIRRVKMVLNTMIESIKEKANPDDFMDAERVKAFEKLLESV